MKKDVIIQEDNYTGVINEGYKQIGQEIDNVIAQYVQVLSNLANCNMEGETAGKLSHFAEQVSMLLENVMSAETENCAQTQVKFIGELATADK